MARGDRFFFHPTRTVYDRPEEHGLAYESVRFSAPDGPSLHGWFFPAVGSARGTIVHCHGNAGNITGHYRFVAWLPARGWNVFCFDYRGYGRSQGNPSRSAVISDVGAALDYIATRGDVEAGRLVLFGQSLGGTVALLAAGDRSDLAAVAVEGAFADWQEEASFVCRRTWWLWGVSGIVSRLFVAPGLNALHSVSRMARIPKLFVCGKRDAIVDYRQTLALHQAAPDPKQLWVLDDGGHTDALIDDDPGPRSPGVARRDRFCEFLSVSVNGSAP